MPRYVVADKSRKRAEVDDDRLDIGSRSSCALTLDDPIVASTHCEIIFREGRFWLRDLGSVTGTYVNGLKVGDPRPLESGDVIVIGASRLLAQIEEEQGSKSLKLETQEKQFFFQKAGQARGGGDQWVIGDREAWRESEVSFSRFPLLWNLVWGSIAAVIVASALLFFAPFRNPLAEPGTLHETHARLFGGAAGDATAGDAPASPRAAHIASVAGEGCGSCHDPYVGAPAANCYQCHEQIARAHPAASDDLPPAQWHEAVCAECHFEHQRTTSGDGVFVPPPSATESDCLRCHEENELTVERAAEFARKFFTPAGGTPDGVVAASPPAPIPYDAFNHAQHVGKLGADSCTQCHTRREQRGPDGRDFVAVDFAVCMSCHGGSTQLAPAFEVDWHGARAEPERCLSCHGSLYDPSLRQGERASIAWNTPDGQKTAIVDTSPKLPYAYQRRSHHAELAQAEGRSARACLECHQRGTWPTSDLERQGLFWHRLHMSKLAGNGRELSLECRTCHEEVANSKALATPAYLAEGAPCKECHTGDRRNEPRLLRERLAFGETAKRNEFPHDRHLDTSHESLRDGCLACHEFQRVGSAEYEAIPITKEAAKNCSGCHDKAHGSIGGGDCEKCHPAGDPVYGMPLDDPRWPSAKVRPSGGTFRHFSAGHRADAEKNCMVCHGDVSKATTIRSVMLPSEESAECRDCHVGKRQRFHWR